MTSRRKTVILVAGAVLLLLLGTQLGWLLRGAPPGMASLLSLLAQLEAKPATEAQLRQVSIQKTSAVVSGVEMPVVTVTNFRPVLEAEGDTFARQLAVLCTRNEGIPRTAILGRKASKTLEFDWQAASYKRLPQPKPYPANFSCPQECPRNVLYTGKYLIGTMGGTDYLCIKTPRGIRKLPWEHPTDVHATYILDGYRYAAGIEDSKSNGRVVGIIIYDLDALDVAARIPVPPQEAHFSPVFVLDANTDLLLCFELDLAWIVCVDLRPARLAAEAAEKQAPPSEKKEP